MYPQVVERAINECPGVRESVVIGVPDKKRGERVIAAVVAAAETLTPREIRDFLGDRLVRLPAARRIRLPVGPATQRNGKSPEARSA